MRKLHRHTIACVVVLGLIGVAPAAMVDAGVANGQACSKIGQLVTVKQKKKSVYLECKQEGKRKVWRVRAGSSGGTGGTGGGTTGTTTKPGAISWSYTGSEWRASGTPPACPSPIIQPIVNLSLATAVLYPGQTRGGNYKPHGGFRFDLATSNDVMIVAPIGGKVWRGARYLESGEVQYVFDVINDCGIAFRLDHLLELAPKFATLAGLLPAASASSATTDLQSGGVSVSLGETIATAVGFRSPRNVFVDLGVYDLRKPNPLASKSGEFAGHGTCWLELLSPADVVTVKAMPPGDGVQGRTSDYCR